MVKIGIVGLPNAGKSTLFNAFLKRQQALSAPYPFATIEPNIGIVDVPDERVDRLAAISHSQKKVYATIEFIDIAGIVKGAHRGEGLGNRFLAHIREVDLVLVLLRAFVDKNVSREGSVSPESDFEIIKSELVLKDLETVANWLAHSRKILKTKEGKLISPLGKKILAHLNKNLLVSRMKLNDEEMKLIKSLNLLTAKPFLKVLNVSEEEISAPTKELVVSAKIEAELANLNDEDRKLYLQELGLKESPLDKVIKKAYQTLGLATFLTTGEKESRAWKFRQGMTAPQCAGVIHSDFFKNFIVAEVVTYDDFVNLGSKQKAREAGKLRLEGKDYIMDDGDVVEFRVGKGK